MNQISNQDFDEVFLNVRNAYRLLYLYQSRVIDIMKFIGDQLSLRYAGGWSWFGSASPKDGKGKLDDSAWDYLNMYMYEFHFNQILIDNNNIRFSVVIISDTGYYDAFSQDKRELNTFALTELSETKLLFLAGKNSWYSDFKDFDINYGKQSLDYVRKTELGCLLVKSYNIKRFLDEATSLKAINEFVEFCNLNGISELSTLHI